MESARAALANGSYGALSLRAVAQKAGITPGAIYRHFRDRAELIDQVVSESLAAYELELTRAIAAHPVGSVARLVAMGRRYMEFAHEHPEEFKVLFSPFRSHPRRLAELPGRGGFDLLRQCVVEAMKSGELSDGDPDLVAFFLWSRVHGILMLLLACDFSGETLASKKAFTAELAFEQTRALAFHGVAPAAVPSKPVRSSKTPAKRKR
jgi:AcrR family transcriptional regulator